jgi:urease accessory protein UreH
LGLHGRLDAVFSQRSARARATPRLVEAEAGLPHTLAQVSSEGPLDLRRPVAAENRWFLRNVTAGVFGGDSYDVSLTCESGASARVESTSASKVYAMPCEGAASRLHLRAEQEARLVWGPQVTILHANSDYTNQIDVDLAGGVVVIAETVVMGRLAAGEVFAFRRYEPSLVVRDALSRVLFAERASLIPARTLRDAMGGRGALSTVYALGMHAEAATGERLTCLTQALGLAGWSMLPNGAGIVAKALVETASQGETFARACIDALT